MDLIRHPSVLPPLPLNPLSSSQSPSSSQLLNSNVTVVTPMIPISMSPSQSLFACSVAVLLCCCAVAHLSPPYGFSFHFMCVIVFRFDAAAARVHRVGHSVSNSRYSARLSGSPVVDMMQMLATQAPSCPASSSSYQLPVPPHPLSND
jgi:hypothetical protein